MREKIEWYGEIPADVKWLTFADQRDKGYEYDNPSNAHKITASTDDNGGLPYDDIKFEVEYNNEMNSRTCEVEFTQKGGETKTCKVTQKAPHKLIPTGKESAITYVESVSVTPDDHSCNYNETEYQFSASYTATPRLAKQYYWSDLGESSAFYDTENLTDGTPINDTDVSNFEWEKVSGEYELDSSNGKITFSVNDDENNTRTFIIKGTYKNHKSNSTGNYSDEGSIIQGTGVRTYQLEVNPVTLNWKADELNKQEFTVKSTFNDNYRFDYTIPTLTNFKYELKSTDGLIDTYEIWPKNENASKNLVSENLNVIQNENKNEKSLTLNQLGVDMTPPFDYIVLKYIWTDADGKDFDTATHVEGTKIDDLDNKYVGFGFGFSIISHIVNDETHYYLQHGGDNRQSGAECVMINMKEIMDNCGEDIESFDVYVAGTWFSERDRGNVTCEMTLYEGGEMEGPKDYIFTNVGGKEVDKRSLTKNVYSKCNLMTTPRSSLGDHIEYAKAYYTTVAKITYYVKTKTANIEEDKTNYGLQKEQEH